ncbi:MAG: DUF554 domain-containing protein [Anaerolineae bacterium]|nr:DUF554 domain-containing protein [Anaerolineae bacterium]
MTGTLVNVAAVLVGSAVGLLLRKRFPEKIQAIIFQAVGLATLALGMKLSLAAQNFLVLIFSLILGGIVGELAQLEARFEAASEALKRRVHSQEARFTEGLITAFLIFCVGSMTIVGAINEGLRGDPTLLLTKSVLDGFTSLALASLYGVGVLFSTLPLLLFQGAITLLAGQAQGFFTPVMIDQLTAVGGVLILGIGLNLLEIKRIQTTHLLPALVVVVILTLIAG